MPLSRFALLLLAGAIGLATGGFGDPSAALAQPAAAAAEVKVETDLAGAKDLARRALKAGQPDLAVRIARQILAVFPQDAEANLLLAAALTRAGHPAEAAAAARSGYRLAEGKAARFEGAYLAAEALALSGHPWAAKFWLRKADLHAPSPAHEAMLARAYAGLSSRSRLSFGLALFGGPSDNVNGGSLHDTFWFAGIPIPITEALPGTLLGTQASLAYALSPRSQARLTWAHGEVFLGQRARDRDPEARGSDYRRDEVTLGLSHVWQDDTGRLALLTSASIGRRWTGGEHSADLARATVELRHGVNDRWSLSGTLDAQSVHVPFNPVADSVTLRATFSSSSLLPRVGGVTFALGAVEVKSDAAGIAWRGPALALGWRPPAKDGRIGLNFDLEAERRDYWMTPSFDPDVWVSFSATAEIPSLEVMGFQPEVTLQAARTWSEVVTRDTRDLGISFGLHSSF